MLRWRLVSAAGLISGLVALLWLDYRSILGTPPGLLLLPLALVGILLGTRELLDLLSARQLAPHAFETAAGTLLIALAAAVSLLGPETVPVWLRGAQPTLWALAAGLFGLFLGEMARYREPGGVTLRIAAGTLIQVYLGLMGSFLIALRLFHSNAWGLAALISMILVVKLSDAGAYFAGRALGRHPLAPLLSPKKTVEGSLGGIVASIAGAGLFCHFFLPWFIPDAAPVAPWRWIVYGLVLAVTGMLGDLAESLIKRDMGRKDAGQLLPGMGGVLDVLDSLLWGAPVACLCWNAGLLGPA